MHCLGISPRANVASLETKNGVGHAHRPTKNVECEDVAGAAALLRSATCATRDYGCFRRLSKGRKSCRHVRHAHAVVRAPRIGSKLVDVAVRVEVKHLVHVAGLQLPVAVVVVPFLVDDGTDGVQKVHPTRRRPRRLAVEHRNFVRNGGRQVTRPTRLEELVHGRLDTIVREEHVDRTAAQVLDDVGRKPRLDARREVVTGTHHVAGRNVADKVNAEVAVRVHANREQKDAALHPDKELLPDVVVEKPIPKTADRRDKDALRQVTRRSQGLHDRSAILIHAIEDVVLARPLRRVEHRCDGVGVSMEEKGGVVAHTVFGEQGGVGGG